MSIILRFFSRRWLAATVIVVFGVGLCVRLGIWQLDRLDARRAFNARVQAQVDQPPLELLPEALTADVYNQEYRKVIVSGRYDHSQEIAIINQASGAEWGVHLVTPLVIEGSRTAVMVDRGWIPAEDYQNGAWSKYREPGRVTVEGIFRRPQVKADWGGRTDPPLSGDEGFRKSWNFVNLGELSKQVDHPLLNAYIQQAPDPAWTGLPRRSLPELELTEGPHMGYALQWFTFAGLLGLGYPLFINHRERPKKPVAESRSGFQAKMKVNR